MLVCNSSLFSFCFSLQQFTTLIVSDYNSSLLLSFCLSLQQFTNPLIRFDIPTVYYSHSVSDYNSSLLSFCFRLEQFSLKLMFKCMYMCAFMLNQFRDPRTTSDLELKVVLCYDCTHMSSSVPEMQRLFATMGRGGHLFFCFFFLLFENYL